jgi:hypothetical protein
MPDRVTINMASLGPNPRVVTIDHAAELAEFFFNVDPSSSSLSFSFDEWVVKTPPNRFVPEDLHCVNATMGARTSPTHWHALMSDSGPPWLRSLRPDWDLVSMPESEWQARGCGGLIEAALSGIMGKFRGPAVATKVLHLKRPLLIPICDSFVAGQMGTTLKGHQETTRLILHLRDEARADQNLRGLLTIQRHLEAAGKKRSLVRILDALLWCTAQDSFGRELQPWAEFRRWLALWHRGS